MNLTIEQRNRFNEDGYLFFPSLFSPEEIQKLLAVVPELYQRREEYNVREKGSDAVRTNFAAHLYSKPFAKLARHPRMIKPVEDLLGEHLYMHQFKINGKMAFEGDVWQWHQDYGTWVNDDLMPAERAMNIAIFLDEVTEFMDHYCLFLAVIKKESSKQNMILLQPAIHFGHLIIILSHSW